VHALLMSGYGAQIDMSARVKKGYGSGSTPMGNPKAGAAAHAVALKESAKSYLKDKEAMLRLHEMEVDVQTAAAHGTRRNMAVQQRHAGSMRNDAEERIAESEDRRFWLKHVQVTRRKLQGLSSELKAIKADGDEETYAPRVLRLIMNLWQSQAFIRVIQIWQAQMHARSTKTVIDAVKNVGALRGSANTGVDIAANPTTFLIHAKKQAERLKQAKSEAALKQGISFEAFQSTRDAVARKAAVAERVEKASVRSLQSDDRRHNIEPATIYLKCWWPADKLRAGKRFLANYYLSQYYKSHWERVDTDAGVYFFHKASNQVHWDSRPADAHKVTSALRDKVWAAEDRGELPRSVLDNH